MFGKIFKPGSVARKVLRLGYKWVGVGLPVRARLEIARSRSWIARHVFGVPKQVRENMVAALSHRYDESEIDRIARLHTEFATRGYVLRRLVLPPLRGFHDLCYWPVEGEEHLNVALNEERGIILVTGHLYYARLIAPILRSHGYKVRLVKYGRGQELEPRQSLDERLAEVSRVMRYLYKQRGLLVDLDDSQDIIAGLDVRPIFSALSCNECVMILGDGMRAADFVELSLFGRPYPFPTGFMKIAMLTGAPVLPVFALPVFGLRAGDISQIRVRIHSPLTIDPKASVETNVEEFAGVLNEQLWETPYLWERWGVENVFMRVLQWSQSDLRIRYTENWENVPQGAPRVCRT